VHGTTHPVDPATGAANALAFAMYHPAAALRSPAVERDSVEDIARLPSVLVRARDMRAANDRPGPEMETRDAPGGPTMDPAPMLATAEPAADETAQLTLF
jgi:hypothetical protein